MAPACVSSEFSLSLKASSAAWLNCSSFAALLARLNSSSTDLSSSGLQARGGNFLNLKAQQVQLLRVGFFVHDERGFFGFQLRAAADEFAKGFAFLFQSAERVENRKLLRGMQQRLMVVRAVHVHQPFADGGEDVAAWSASR